MQHWDCLILRRKVKYIASHMRMRGPDPDTYSYSAPCGICNHRRPWKASAASRQHAPFRAVSFNYLFASTQLRAGWTAVSGGKLIYVRSQAKRNHGQLPKRYCKAIVRLVPKQLSKEHPRLQCPGLPTASHHRKAHARTDITNTAESILHGDTKNLPSKRGWIVLSE